jgi:hypothetical protein
MIDQKGHRKILPNAATVRSITAYARERRCTPQSPKI